MNPESIKRVEQELENNYDAVNAILHEHVEQHGALIDDGLEQDVTMLAYASHLNGFLLSYDATHESWQVVYRSVHFASAIAGLLGCNRGLYLGDTFTHSDPDAVREQVTQEAQDYMITHEYIDGLTGAFMPEIDPGGRYAHIAETVVALVSSQIEQELEREAAQELVASWDGTLDELL